MYYYQPFHCATFVKHLELDWMAEYANANQGIMPESHNIRVQYMEIAIANTFPGKDAFCPVLYIRWTPPNQICQCQECLPARNPVLTFSKSCNNTHQWILCHQAQEYVVVLATYYKYLHGWAECDDGFIPTIKQNSKIPIVPVRPVVVPAKLVWANAVSDWIDRVWLENGHVDLGT